MADLCALKRVSLNTVSAFSDQDDEWPLALLSIYESIYTFECKKMQAMMKAKGLTDVLLTGGGIIPDADTEKLQNMGVGKLFAPGANTQEIALYITNWVAENRSF